LAVALRHPKVGLLLVLFFLSTFAFANFESTFALLLLERFGLTMIQVTYLFVFIGVLAALVQGGLVGRLSRRFGERNLILTGAVLLLPAYLAMVGVASLPALLGILPVLALGAGLVGPALSSLVSRLSAEDEQGGILGVYQSMASLARILGPFWGVYAFSRFGSATPYWTAAGTAVLVLLLALALWSKPGDTA
jgi:MFS family permease